MFQKASRSWAAASRFVYQNQYRTVPIYSGATVAGFAVVDFTREIFKKICDDFYMRRSVHLAESLEQLQSAAFDGTIQYADTLINRDKSVDLYYLSAIAEKHYSAYTRHPGLQDAWLSGILGCQEKLHFCYQDVSPRYDSKRTLHQMVRSNASCSG